MADYIKSTNFAIKDGLTTGDPSKRIKGTEIDVELVAVASAISSKADSNSPALTGTPTAPTAVAGTSTTQIATTAFATVAATAAGAAAFPSGGIIMWSGSIVSIPSGWYLCNGSNGTPDLRDRFIVGAGSTYSVAATGGSKDSIVVAHTHSATTNTTGEHTHNYLMGSSVYANSGGNQTDYGDSNRAIPTLTTTASGLHSHTVTVSSTGSSGTDANLPPYYALAFIMKA